MYPAPFEYHVPSTVAEAVALLGQWQDDAKLISGSQSLVPMMKLRLVQPKHVIDLRKVPGLSGVSEAEGSLLIGAFITYRAIETSEIARARLPILPETAGNIGDAQVRNLGTIGGSLAHADPSADWPAARSGSAYEKLPHPASRFAVVGVAAAVALDEKGAVQRARVALTGLGPKVTRAASVEQALQGKATSPESLKAAAGRAAEGLELRPDSTGTADYKAHLAAVYTERALRRALARAIEG